jgi:S-adenosylmethionine:tRNA ribosyltransferase-isomerase
MTPRSTQDAAEYGGQPPGMPEARRSDFEFDLPPELIAQHPAEQRESARLLHVHKDSCNDGFIPDLVEALHAGDVLVLNDTRVIKARLHGEKDSGGRVEVLVERALSAHRAHVLLHASHAPRSGTTLRFGAAPGASATPGASFAAKVLGRTRDLYELDFATPLDEVLEAIGQVPLPPYIRDEPASEDAARYQTVYARAPGAVAAPTAGLHLSDALLARVRARGVHIAFVTLHVGAGTFQPVRAQRVSEHRMHSERYHVPAETADIVNRAHDHGKQVIAVGTTSVRALESRVLDGRVQPGGGETRLFILPGFRFQCVDHLLTNFHLPGSTLLMLVAAFAGTQRIRQAYQHAVAKRYRFFSYGDAMLVERDRSERQAVALEAGKP